MITLTFYNSESDSYPEELDMDSSPTTVYIRRNIREVERTDDIGEGEPVTRTVYVYEEAKLSHADYAIYCEEINTANIDYIAAMTDVDLDV